MDSFSQQKVSLLFFPFNNSNDRHAIAEQPKNISITINYFNQTSVSFSPMTSTSLAFPISMHEITLCSHCSHGIFCYISCPNDHFGSICCHPFYSEEHLVNFNHNLWPAITCWCTKEKHGLMVVPWKCQEATFHNHICAIWGKILSGTSHHQVRYNKRSFYIMKLYSISSF